MIKKEKSAYLVQTVANALEILEQFHDDVDELGVTALSKRLKLHKNKVFRLLATLEFRNFIEQNRTTENYRLGLKILELGQTYTRQTGLLRQARPVLEKVARECNETTYLATLQNFQALYLDVVESNLAVRVFVRVGARVPAHCSAAGKVQIARKTNVELEKSLAGSELKRYTESTITDRKELKKQLLRIAEQGYAIDDQELDREVISIAAPIRDYSGQVVGAVAITGPSFRFSIERLERELIPLVKRGAEEVSARLGYRDNRVKPVFRTPKRRLTPVVGQLPEGSMDTAVRCSDNHCVFTS